MRKICVVTGTRADWGLLSPIAKALKARPDVIVQIVATNMHLSPKFGNTYKEILADGFKINCHVSMLDDTNTPGNTVRSMGVAMSGFASVFEELKPDMILILGDRYEMLAVASTALIFRIISFLRLQKKFLADNGWMMPRPDNPFRWVTYLIGFIYGPVPPYITCIAWILQYVLQ